MKDAVKITLVPYKYDDGRDMYAATMDGSVYLGTSPDEALGYAVRESVLIYGPVVTLDITLGA